MLTKLVKSFAYAFAGIIYAFNTQRNMKIHIFALFLLVIFGLYFKLFIIEWALVLLTAALVMVSEILNTAIEALVDLKTQEYHPLAKIAKDVAAGAVLIASIFSVIIGILIFIPKIFSKFFI